MSPRVGHTHVSEEDDLRRCADFIRGVAHDDTLRDAFDRVSFAIQRGVEQMVGCFLEGCQHEYLYQRRNSSQ